MGFNPFEAMGLSCHEAGLFGFSIDRPPPTPLLWLAIRIYNHPSKYRCTFKKVVWTSKYIFIFLGDASGLRL